VALFMPRTVTTQLGYVPLEEAVKRALALGEAGAPISFRATRSPGGLMTCSPEVSAVHYACHFGPSEGVFPCRPLSDSVARSR
jgi:hypothetical protein